MFAGPVFTREVVTAPRRARLYVSRATYVFALLVLMSTAWQVLTGTTSISDIGDLARFGSMSFQLLVPLVLAVALFFAALSAAGAVANEKDRKTLDLLLLSRLSNVELVLGKLLASLLSVVALVVAAVPVFMIAALLGGVSFPQIGRVFAVVLSSAVAAGSLGTVLAFWREKTFQSLAMTLLALVFWLGLGEALAAGAFGDPIAGASAEAWATAVSPWRAALAATRPMAELAGAVEALPGLGDPVRAFLVVAAGLTVLVNGTAIALVRAWNPSREARTIPVDSDEPAPAPAGAGHHWQLTSRTEGAQAGAADRHRPKTRRVWDNPILWREVRTWAYGRKMVLVRLAYLVLFAASTVGLHRTLAGKHSPSPADVALAIVPLAVLSLVLVNVQAVTALTSERDARALDLLLVTDLTPPEFIVGKLAGALYNTKEMVLLPLVLCAYLVYQRAISVENLIYLAGGWLVMVAFVTMLGVHCGMNYANSRAAIAVSVGTVFFLLVGVATCMRIMVAFSGSFQFQLQPFLAFMVGGGVGLLVALGWRNASTAIWFAAFSCPFATFYAITSFLLGYTLAVFLVVAATYGFTTAAMLIPAIYEFDVATGRTTVEEG
ncbi:MAG: ABC transporter permease [Planctomycetia bacterium]|nr:ABC transporter permease [Planctomycetia bacterium]